jgi:hypothetical protein
VLSEEAPDRWAASIGLSGVEIGIMSPAARGGRVRVTEEPSETIALLRLHGQPAARAILDGAAKIADALIATPWAVAGEPMLRLHAPISSLPFLAHFEVAVPVVTKPT